MVGDRVGVLVGLMLTTVGAVTVMVGYDCNKLDETDANAAGLCKVVVSIDALTEGVLGSVDAVDPATVTV